MERKSWRLWIVAVIAMMLVCLTASAVTAEETITAITEPVTVSVKGGLTNEEAAEGYIRNLFQIPTETKGRNLRGVSAGSLLTGKEAIVYSILKEKIEEVARGNQPNTFFSFPLSRINAKFRYNAEELRVKSIKSNGELSDEAWNAFQQQFYVDYKKVVDALLLDCPYDLYWFDKTAGYRYPLTVGIRYNSTEIWVNEDASGTIEVPFYVSKDYSASGGTGTYMCKTSYGQNAVAAANNAQQIINDNAGKSDYQRLTAYKNRICELASYNTSAAGGGRDYGDPWQLVWVFDNDTSTTVVCEGYSKAFQYLCDNTKWHGDVETISVSGTMNGGTGAGRHMWNIVTMGDGKHYMADITNSDAGTVGGNGGLFLNGYTSRGEDDKTYYFRAGGKDICYTYNDDTYATFSATGKLELAGTAATDTPALATPSVTLPEGAVIAGVPFNITINEVENADYYMLGISGPQYGDETEERRIKQSGNYMPEAYGLDEGSYTISLTAMSFDSDYENSDTAEITLAVTGQRPAIPTIVMPTGEIHWGDTVLIEARQDNAEAIWYEVKGLSEELRTQDGLAMIPVVANETADYVFRARANGAWSRETDTYTLTATMGTIPEISMTVPETILQGQDVTVSGITVVPGARVYAYRLSGPDQNVYDEPFAIVYDEPFNPTDRTLTIPGYHFTQAGSYDISITAYRDHYGNMLSEAVGHITVTENTNLPDAPTAEWEEDDSSTEIYGKSRFTVTTTGGADRIYAFVYSEYDEGEVLPTAIDTNPNEQVYTCELINRRAGNPLIACFAVYRNGFWSEVSEGVTHYVYYADEGQELGRVNFTCPRETVLGEDFTVQWSPVDHAEWYELELWAGEEMLSCKTVPASGTSSYSQVVSTEGITNSGEYSVRVKAFAEGYDTDEGHYTSIQLLDPKQRITVAGTQAPATANIVTMTLGNVTANRIRVRIDGADAGMYAVNPTNGTVTLTIPITNRDGQIQAANYDTNSRKWGAWSYPVSENDEFRAMTFGTTESTWYMGLEPYQGTEDGVFSNNTAIFYYEGHAWSDGNWSCVCLDGPDCFEVQQTQGDQAEACLVPKNNITAGTAVYRVICTVGNTAYVAETTINIVDAQETLPEIHLEEAAYTAETNNLGEWTATTGNLSLILGDQRAIKTVIDGEGQTENQQTNFMIAAFPDQNSCLNYNYLTENGIDYSGDMLLISGRKPGSDSVTVQVDLDGTNVRYYKTITARIAGMMLPANLTKIEANAFEGIDAEAVYIPDGCTEIGAGAFKNCKKLKYVSYKKGTIIGEGAFDGCSIVMLDER